jgi:hypothetical protein
VARVLSSALSASLPAPPRPARCARGHTLHETHTPRRHTGRAATHHASPSRSRIAAAPAPRIRHTRRCRTIPSSRVCGGGHCALRPPSWLLRLPVRLSRRCGGGGGGGGGEGVAAPPAPPLSHLGAPPPSPGSSTPRMHTTPRTSAAVATRHSPASAVCDPCLIPMHPPTLRPHKTGPHTLTPPTPPDSRHPLINIARRALTACHVLAVQPTHTPTSPWQCRLPARLPSA